MVVREEVGGEAAGGVRGSGLSSAEKYSERPPEERPVDLAVDGGESMRRAGD